MYNCTVPAIKFIQNPQLPTAVALRTTARYQNLFRCPLWLVLFPKPIINQFKWDLLKTFLVQVEYYLSLTPQEQNISSVGWTMPDMAAQRQMKMMMKMARQQKNKVVYLFYLFLLQTALQMSTPSVWYNSLQETNPYHYNTWCYSAKICTTQRRTRTDVDNRPIAIALRNNSVGLHPRYCFCLLLVTVRLPNRFNCCLTGPAIF